MKKRNPVKIKDFISALKYVKMAECSDFAAIDSLQKMLGCKPMDLMRFIDENKNLIHTKILRKNDDNISVPIGLCVFDAYEKEEENPYTEIGRKKLVKNNKKKLWVVEIIDTVDNERHLGYYLEEDTKPDCCTGLGINKLNYEQAWWLWRNTTEKIKQLADNGYCKEKIVSFKDYDGGYFTNKFEHYLTKTDIKEIKEKFGYEFIVIKL